MAIADYKLQTTHTKFLIGFSASLYAICNAVNIDKLAKWFNTNDGLDYPALSAYLLAGLGLFIALFTLVAHRRTIKPLAVALAITSAAATYFISKYDVAIDSSMVRNVIHTDPIEIRQLLSIHMVPYVLALMILPALLVLRTDITFAASGKYLFDSAKLLVVSLTVALGCLLLNYSPIYRAGNVSNKYIVYSLVPVNILSSTISVIAKSIKPHLQPDQKSLVISGRVASPDNLVVVLAIGETSRKKNFSAYGYARRPTNPTLRKQGNLHFLNGIARRGTTLDALPEILEKNGIKLPTIVSKLGIPTACYVNYTLYDNCSSVGETAVSQCGHDGKCYDEDVIPLLAENLKSYASGYRFVVLHLGGGSHGPTYIDRYPPEFQQFQPVCKDADIANRCTIEQLYNSYDNSILYVDYVLSGIIGALNRSGVPHVLIYLSDHGESLMEEGRMFHGMPPGVSLPPEQAQIPMIVKSSVPINIDQRTEYRQQDVFDTVLDLFTIQTGMFDNDGGFIRKLAATGPSSVAATTGGGH